MSDYEPTPDDMRIACLAGHHTPVVIETLTFYSFSTDDPRIFKRTRNILECSVCCEPLYEIPVDEEVAS